MTEADTIVELRRKNSRLIYVAMVQAGLGLVVLACMIYFAAAYFGCQS